MINWTALLQRKYDILQQQADTQRMGVSAAATLDRTRAGLLPAESSANVKNTLAQAGLYGSQARNIDEETKYVGPLARASIGESGARSLNYKASAGYTTEQTAGERLLNKSIGGMFRLSDPLDFAEGMRRLRMGL